MDWHRMARTSGIDTLQSVTPGGSFIVGLGSIFHDSTSSKTTSRSRDGDTTHRRKTDLDQEQMKSPTSRLTMMTA